MTSGNSSSNFPTMISQWLQPDPALSEHSTLIEKQLERCAGNLQPENLRELLGKAGREMVSVTVAAMQADSASIWLVDPEKTRLIVSHVSPIENNILHHSQPLDEGLVSLVVQSEQPICENEVYTNTGHSKKIDSVLSSVTSSMVAVPLYAAGDVRGVFSCVRIKDSMEAPDPPRFSSADLGRLRRLANGIEHILNYRMLSVILDLDL